MPIYVERAADGRMLASRRVENGKPFDQLSVNFSHAETFESVAAAYAFLRKVGLSGFRPFRDERFLGYRLDE